MVPHSLTQHFPRITHKLLLVATQNNTHATVQKRHQVRRLWCPHQHVIGHFREKSFQSITCAGIVNQIRTTDGKSVQETPKICQHKVTIENNTQKHIQKTMIRLRTDRVWYSNVLHLAKRTDQTYSLVSQARTGRKVLKNSATIHNVRKLVRQCRAILNFAAARDDGNSSEDNRNYKVCTSPAASPSSLTYQHSQTGCPSCRPNQQCQSTKGTHLYSSYKGKKIMRSAVVVYIDKQKDWAG